MVFETYLYLHRVNGYINIINIVIFTYSKCASGGLFDEIK